MADHKGRIVVTDLTRNGVDSPWEIDDQECADAVNVDYYHSNFGRKRDGFQLVNTDFNAGGNFTGKISFVMYVMRNSRSNSNQLFAVDDAAVSGVQTFVHASPWEHLTSIKDALSASSWQMTGANINSLGFVTYNSAVNRMHVLDASNNLRRAGVQAPAVPTVANTGGGAYAAVLRYYRMRWTVQDTGVTIRRSEPSPSVSFTPSGAGTAARVTQSAVVGENETHWEVEASVDGVTFYRIATVVVGTTTYDDSAVTTTYNTNPLSALTGVYTVQKSYRMVAGDQNRTLGLGSFLVTDKQNRLEISAVVGSLDIGDAERVDTTTNYFLDFDESDSGQVTGLAGPIEGFYFVFKERQVWKLTATGNISQPYRADAVSKKVGAVEHYAITTGVDKFGNAALYWMSFKGVYQWTVARGMVYIGKGIEDYVIGPNSSLRSDAVPSVAARCAYIPKKNQVQFWWTVDTDTEPNMSGIYDVEKGRWSRTLHGDYLNQIRCVTVSQFPITAPPIMGMWFGAAALGSAVMGTLDDNGFVFQSYVKLKAYEPGGPGSFGECGDATLMMQTAANFTVDWSVERDFNLNSDTVTSSEAIVAYSASPPSFVSVRLQGSGAAGARFYSHKVGDFVNAAAKAWSIERLVIPVTARGQDAN